METILNAFIAVIEALPPVISAGVLMIGFSALAAAVLCFAVAAVAVKRES